MADFPIVLPAGARFNQITSLDDHRTDPDAHPNYVHKDQFGADLTAEVKRHNLDSKAHPDIRAYIENMLNQHISNADPHPEYKLKFEQDMQTHGSDPNAHQNITNKLEDMLNEHVSASLPHHSYDIFLREWLAAHNNSPESHKALKSVIDETIQNHIDDAEAHKAIFDKLTEKIGEDIGDHKADELAHAEHYIRRDELTDSKVDYEKNKELNLSDNAENYNKINTEQTESGEGIKAHVITAFVLNQIFTEYGLNDVKSKGCLFKDMVVRSDEQVPDITSPNYGSYVPSLDLFLKYRKIAVDAKELAEDLKNKITNPSITGRAVYPSNPKGEYGNDFMVRMASITDYEWSSADAALSTFARRATASAIREAISKNDDFYIHNLPIEEKLDLTKFECIPYLVASDNVKSDKADTARIRTQRAKVNFVVGENSDGSPITSEYPFRDIVSVTREGADTYLYVHLYNSIEIEAGVEQAFTKLSATWYLDIHLRRIA